MTHYAKILLFNPELVTITISYPKGCGEKHLRLYWQWRDEQGKRHFKFIDSQDADKNDKFLLNRIQIALECTGFKENDKLSRQALTPFNEVET